MIMCHTMTCIVAFFMKARRS